MNAQNVKRDREHCLTPSQVIGLNPRLKRNGCGLPDFTVESAYYDLVECDEIGGAGGGGGAGGAGD